MPPATASFFPASSIDPAAPDSIYRLSVAQYHRMIEFGVLHDGDPVEMLEGLLLVKHTPATLYRLSAEQYHAMIDAGILTPDDRVELLEGWLVQKMSQNPPHAVAAELTVIALRAVAPAGWFVRSEKPISLGSSDPEPDAALARGAPRDYLRRHPSPADLALVVEVSDATLDQDRRMKLTAYARAAIACYWVVNLLDRRVEVYTQPAGAAYTQWREFAAGETIPFSIDGAEVGRVAVADLLP